MRDHDQLLWAISDGSRSDMDAWSRKDVFEFFRGLSIHDERVKQLLKKTNGDRDRVQGYR